MDMRTIVGLTAASPPLSRAAGRARDPNVVLVHRLLPMARVARRDTAIVITL